MKAFKYSVINAKRAKSQIICMCLFGFVAYGFTRNSALSGVTYLAFAAIMLQGTTFTLEQKTESGFINMLPGTEVERIMGKFIMGILYATLASIFSLVCLTVIDIQGISNVDHIFEILLFFAGVELTCIAIQNVMFYMFGKGYSQQLMTFVNMVPGFSIYIVMNILLAIYEHKGNEFPKIITWLQNNMTILSVGIFVLGIVVTCICVKISEKIVCKKDFS